MEFLGYERPNGTVGVRNHVAVISASGCANELAATIADGVQGTVAILHDHACARLKPDNERALQTLIDVGSNPNVAAAVVVGIGCDILPADEIARGIAKSKKPVEAITIEAAGGFQQAVDKGQETARDMMSQASQMTRTPCALSHLTVGVKCGGSATISPLAGHPATGKVFDALIAEGGRAIFTETAEVIGAEHILAKRAVNEEVRQRLLEVVARMEKTIRDSGVDIRGAQPSPGNIKSGLTTIEEKSLGAMVKAGSSPLRGVLEYGERPEGQGLFFMDSSAWPSILFLGMAAAGAQIFIFSVGGGLPAMFRSNPGAGWVPIVPMMKIIGDPNLKGELEWFDIYAGTIIEGEESVEQVGRRFFHQLVNVASGKLTKVEMRSGYREILDMYATGPIM
jgi:altronate dehydratase large subunit